MTVHGILASRAQLCSGVAGHGNVVAKETVAWLTLERKLLMQGLELSICTFRVVTVKT